MFKPTNRLDGCYQRHGRGSSIMHMVLMIANASGTMQETKMGTSVSGKWAFSLILIVIETLNERDGYILG